MDAKFCYMADAFEKNGFTFSDVQKRQFYVFYEMLVEKNRVMNLTRITEFQEVVEKHFLDSIFLHRVVDLNGSLSVLDLGTGAGFPGIPLKIAFPGLELVLVDSSRKKVDFLNEVIGELGLLSIRAVHGRAEDLARDSAYREKFDLCVSRAVANLSTLMEYCMPFVRIGGTFVSYKSGEADEEILKAKNACEILGGEIKETYKFHLGEQGRSFVVAEKKKATAGRYPRKAGTPSRMPL